ncbi:TIGR03089 family protein [Phycicoccus sonneratiae]|uniref:TIGR03089 family protein n=1 Tax=Phycicoccus sonneratiae TaxID=2807628 RepID=A0ABS2CPJ0_9MICO|nr:TIGR03089 family protein [Phycicoccus sonneraticus]MBM6400974.1 TIGR03089 family protein [Phycicoccus sonneraticus]
MAPSARTPAALLADLVAADPGRPRVTVYDDTDGPTRGERVELSARVLANWVAKAGNLLQDELDAGPGTVVRLALPPHWRTLYWALAAWSVGACVEVAGPDEDGSGADVVVTDDPARGAGAGDLVVVTLAALARQAAVEVPAGAVDEARQLATHGDVLVAHEEPDADDVALRTGSTRLTFAGVVPTDATGGRVHTQTTDPAGLLRTALAAWAGDGSVVLTRGTPQPDALAARLASEGVTATA